MFVWCSTVTQLWFTWLPSKTFPRIPFCFHPRFYWASHYLHLTFSPRAEFFPTYPRFSISLLPSRFFCPFQIPIRDWKCSICMTSLFVVHSKNVTEKNILFHSRAGLYSVKTAGIKDTSPKVCFDIFRKQSNDPSFWGHFWLQSITSGHFVLSLWCIAAPFHPFEETSKQEDHQVFKV